MEQRNCKSPASIRLLLSICGPKFLVVCPAPQTLDCPCFQMIEQVESVVVPTMRDITPIGYQARVSQLKRTEREPRKTSKK